MRLPRLVALACCAAVASTIALWSTDAIAQAKSASAMGEAVNMFLASLTPERRARAVTRFDDEGRFNWNERPMASPGVVLKELTEPQRKLAMGLLRTSVGEGGLLKIQMSLAREPVLSATQATPEGARRRDPLLFYVEEYRTRMPADVAAERRGRLLEGAALDAIAFQWHGGIERGQAHNYTVQGPTFIIEYAQSRGDNVGHVHTVWRDFDGDFGADIVGTR